MRPKKLYPLVFVLALAAWLTTGCGAIPIAIVTVTPVPTNTPTPTLTATTTPTSTSMSTTTPTNTSAPISTATPTNTPTPTPAPKPTDTATPEPAEVITSTLETGWVLYKVQKEGFAIALPPEWLRVNLDAEAFEDSLAIIGEQNPGLGQLLTSETLRSLAAGGIKFYGLDTSPESLIPGFPTTVNVLKLNLGLALPLDTIVAVNLGQIEAIADPDVPLTNRRVSLSNVEAEEIKYGTEIAMPTGDSILLMITQYLVVDGSIMYVVTLGTPLELTDDYSTTFEEIGKSFRLAP